MFSAGNFSVIHILNLVSSCLSELFQMNPVRNCLDQETLRMIILFLVFSKMWYCSKVGWNTSAACQTIVAAKRAHHGKNNLAPITCAANSESDLQIEDRAIRKSWFLYDRRLSRIADRRKFCDRLRSYGNTLLRSCHRDRRKFNLLRSFAILRSYGNQSPSILRPKRMP